MFVCVIVTSLTSTYYDITNAYKFLGVVLVGLLGLKWAAKQQQVKPKKEEGERKIFFLA